MKCGCGCACSTNTLNDEQKQILAAMEQCGGPCGTKEIATATGIDSKVLTARISDLKKQGLADSPARCKHGITPEGLKVLKG